MAEAFNFPGGSWGDHCPHPTKQKAKHSTAAGTAPAEEGHVQLSLPHPSHVPVPVELVEVVSIPGERAEPR